jgi:hypothetical protein
VARLGFRVAIVKLQLVKDYEASGTDLEDATSFLKDRLHALVSADATANTIRRWMNRLTDAYVWYRICKDASRAALRVMRGVTVEKIHTWCAPSYNFEKPDVANVYWHNRLFEDAPTILDAAIAEAQRDGACPLELFGVT